LNNYSLYVAIERDMCGSKRKCVAVEVNVWH